MKPFQPYQRQYKAQNRTTGPTWPRLICQKALPGINRVISLIGTPEKIKKIRYGSLLIKTVVEYQSTVLLNLNTLAGNINVSFQKDATLNIKKGIMYCPEIDNLSEKMW
jgi:hypothetical protein